MFCWTPIPVGRRQLPFVQGTLGSVCLESQPFSVARVQAWRGSQQREGEPSARHVAQEQRGAACPLDTPEAQPQGSPLPFCRCPQESSQHHHLPTMGLGV